MKGEREAQRSQECRDGEGEGRGLTTDVTDGHGWEREKEVG